LPAPKQKGCQMAPLLLWSSMRTRFVRANNIKICSYIIAQKRVRIPRPKIGKLACQAQGVGIFAPSAKFPLCRRAASSGVAA